MADTYTTVLELTKPEIGGSTDTWGNKLNANADTLDALFDAGVYLKVAKGGTGAGTAANARTNLGLGTLATQNANAVAITGGTASLTSATIGSVTISGGTGVFSSVTIAGGTGAFTTLTLGGLAPYTSSTISGATITESQIQDAAILARVGANETVTGTWNFTAIPGKTGGGKFLHYASATQNSGAITVSTSAPSGTPGEGDLWLQYTA